MSFGATGERDASCHVLEISENCDLSGIGHLLYGDAVVGGIQMFGKKVAEQNKFTGARKDAIAAGKDEFEVDGKKYPVKSVDKDDKENAKDFVKNESVSMKLKDLIKWLD